MFTDTSQFNARKSVDCWSNGAAELSFTLTDGESRLKHLYQSDPCRVLFPSSRVNGPKEAVIVTTSGGVVGGDRLRFDIHGGTSTIATVTTQAAEKIYRSTGEDSVIDISISVRDAAFLEWMPQETILFEGARLRRFTDIAIFGSGRFIAGEIVVFGRRARNEKFTNGLLHDAWRIRADDALVWLDSLHLDGDIGKTINDRYAFDGAATLATVVYGGSDAKDRLAFARKVIRSGAATCIDNILIARFIDVDAARLRANVARYWVDLRSELGGLPPVLPRVWKT
jgi:urease accessory protein